MTPPDVDALADGLADGDRRSLARAITLVESTRPDHEDAAGRLLDLVASRRADADPGIRLGLTGTPGVGKSSLIEALGSRLLERGHRLAVLAVDPTSRRTGGSILGDKTRMPTLAAHPDAFVRPSPSGGSLGGVARRTGAVRDLCEAAGYDALLIETVGVGQSEGAVADLVDVFCLLIAPGGGDELQGVKRGVLELADLVAVNKADGDQIDAARLTAADYGSALRLVRPKWAGRPTPALLVSAMTGSGLDELWDAVVAHRDTLGAATIARLRADQALAMFDAELRDRLLNTAMAGLDHDALAERRDAVDAGRRHPLAAVRGL